MLLDHHGYVQPEVGGVSLSEAHRASAERSTVFSDDRIRARSRDGVEEVREITEPEQRAIAACTVLKSPGVANVIYCADCGEMRIINPQDFFHVTRCAVCQERQRSVRRRGGRERERKY